MRAALIVSFNLFCCVVMASNSDTVQIISSYDTIHLNKTCYLALDWKEIKGPDTLVNRKINDEISGTIKEFSRWHEDDSVIICQEHLSELTTFSNDGTLFGKHNFVSCRIISTAPSAHNVGGHLDEPPYTELITLNFNLRTGIKIKFNELFDPEKIPAVDTLVMHTLMERLKKFHQSPEEWDGQLSDLDFTLNESGINIVFRGTAYELSIIDFIIPYDKLKPFMGKKGLLNLYYQDVK